MVVNNTVKNEGCAKDRIQVCSVQSYVKNERGELNTAKYSPVIVEHGDNDIIIKAQTHEVVKDKAGKVVERRTVKAKENDELVQ